MRKILILAILFLFIFYFRDWLLREYALLFEVDNAKKGADAIIVLAGNYKTRAQKACSLYKDGYAKEIFITSAKEYNDFSYIPNEINLTKLILINECNLIPILIPSQKNGATSTIDEAIDFAYFTKNSDIKHIILVTDAFHTKRSLYTFKKIAKKFDLNITFEVAAAKNKIYDSSNWYKTEKGLQDYVTESAKTILYLFIDSNLKNIKEQ